MWALLAFSFVCSIKSFQKIFPVSCLNWLESVSILYNLVILAESLSFILMITETSLYCNDKVIWLILKESFHPKMFRLKVNIFWNVVQSLIGCYNRYYRWPVHMLITLSSFVVWSKCLFFSTSDFTWGRVLSWLDWMNFTGLKQSC